MPVAPDLDDATPPDGEPVAPDLDDATPPEVEPGASVPPTSG